MNIINTLSQKSCKGWGGWASVERVFTHMASYLHMASPKQIPKCVQIFNQIAQPLRSNMYNALHAQTHKKYHTHSTHTHTWKFQCTLGLVVPISNEVLTMYVYKAEVKPQGGEVKNKNEGEEGKQRQGGGGR